MQIEYVGHSCFHIKSSQGIEVLIDPFDETVGYQVPLRRADFTLLTHTHLDHANLAAVKGATRVVTGAGLKGSDDFPIRSVLAYHDNVQGATHGLVYLFAFEMDGLRFCHLSDLGHVLEPSHVAELGPIDVLCVPVGGPPYTIDAAAAWQVVAQLEPRLIIPMHYRTALTNGHAYPIAGVDAFLAGARHVQVERSGMLRLSGARDLPIHQTVCVLTPTH